MSDTATIVVVMGPFNKAASGHEYILAVVAELSEEEIRQLGALDNLALLENMPRRALPMVRAVPAAKKPAEELACVPA